MKHSRRGGGVMRRATLVLALLFFGCQALAEPAERMNVLLLSIDDMNTWVLGDENRYAGRVVAPNLEKLSRSGVSFTSAFAASPKCSPSRTALLSGMAPWKTGVTDNGVAVSDSKPLAGKTSLPELFKQHGYFTASFGKINHGYKIRDVWDEKVTHKRDPAPPDAMLNGHPRKSENDWGLTHLNESEMNDSKMADLTIEVLQREHDKPFFLACGMFHPHAPFYVPQKYLDLYPLDELVAPPINDDDYNDIPPLGQKLQGGTYRWAMENGQYKAGLQGYLASCSYADAQLGRVLDALEQSPYRDNTIVVLFSDHGYHVGEKLHWQKGTLWEEATNCLLMFRVPGMETADQQCASPASLLDIYPTLAELVGLDKPGHLDGISLTPFIEDPGKASDRPIVTAYRDHLTVRTKQHRYIRYSDGTEELYDRSADPNEWTNRAADPEYATIKAEMIGHLPPSDEVVPMLPYVRKGKNK